MSTEESLRLHAARCRRLAAEFTVENDPAVKVLLEMAAELEERARTAEEQASAREE